MGRLLATLTFAVLAAAPGMAAPGVALAQNLPAPPEARVYILWPHNGQTIPSGKFWLRMGLSGMGIAPAGVEHPNTGHHHLLVDADVPPLDEPIPNDHNHLHFGNGQTEARIELPPGKHTLQLILADAHHRSFDPPLVSQKITVTVRGEAPGRRP